MSTEEWSPGMIPVVDDPYYDPHVYVSSQELKYRRQQEMMRIGGKAIIASPGYAPSKARNFLATATEMPKYNIKMYQKMFEKIGILRSIILKVADLVVSVEKDIRPPAHVIHGAGSEGVVISESLKKNIKLTRQWKRFIQFDSWIRDMFVCALWSGNAYTEVVKNPKSLWKIARLKLIPPDEMRPVRDEFGILKGYLQYPAHGTITWIHTKAVNQYKQQGAVWFEPDEIIHLKIDPMPGEAYGTSIAESLKDILAIVVGMREDIGLIVHNFAAPLMLFRVGTDLIPASPDTVNSVADNLESQMAVSSRVVTSTSVDGTVLDTGKGVMQMDKYFRQMFNILFGSAGVPEILLGQGNETTEATAKMQLESIGSQIKVFHQLIKDVIELPLFSFICVSKGVHELTPDNMDEIPELWFGPVETSEERRIRLENAFKEGMITREEWRKENGMNPKADGEFCVGQDKEFQLELAESGKNDPMGTGDGGSTQQKPSKRDTPQGKSDKRGKNDG